MKSYDDLKALIERRGVHALLGPLGEGWGIEQNPHELATFLVRMQELGVTSCLEIGTGYKGGLSRFLAADMGWRVFTIDVQDYGLGYDGVDYFRLRSDDRIESLPVQISVHVQDFSHMLRFDLVFIDGAHDYASVKADYETYSKLATKVIAFHDIEGLRECEGARQFFEEIACDPESERFWKLKPHCYVASDLRMDYTSSHGVLKPDSKPAGIGWIELE